MSDFYFIGLDNGGSSIKCVIFNQKGAEISSASARVSLIIPSEGHIERDAESIWFANCHVIREALRKSRLNASQISAMSLCGYGGGLILLDHKYQPVHPVIVSTDSRANDLLQEFRANGTDNAIYQLTYQRLWAGQPGMLLPWFSLNHPNILKTASHIVSIKDYVRYRLTDELATEKTDASNTNLFNIHTQCFDLKLFEILGVPDCFCLAPQKLLCPYEIAGYITEQAALATGLKAGTPVSTGLYDVASCTLASGILSENILSAIVGTWTVCGHLVKNIHDCHEKENNMFSFLDEGYFSEESSPTSASNLDWFVDQFFRKVFPSDEDSYEHCNYIVSQMKPQDSNLIFLPFLYGSNSIVGAKASFFNLSRHHTINHMLMAIYEGILFSLRQHIQYLYGEIVPNAIRFSGGASRSPVWAQMLADILNIPIEVMECEELGALGAAICASISSGVYANYAEAVEHMCHKFKTYMPDTTKVPIYDKKYCEYIRAIHSLRCFYTSN